MSAGRRITAAALVLALLVAPAMASLEERELGRKFLLEARGQLPLITDPAVTDYVNEIAARLVKQLGAQEFDYRFFVVQSGQLNAFAVPGGNIFIYSGLLARVKSDDELAGVLAHEIGHVHGHHIVRMQSQGWAWNAAALLGMLLTAVNPVLGAAGIAAAQTAQLKYSRDFEQEADYLGLRYATEAGYDPHALASFFKELLAQQRLNPTNVPAYMLSHPLTEERVSKVDSIIASEHLKSPPGRPAAGPQLAEVRAVTRAIAEPTDLVVDEYRKAAEANPNDAQAQFLLGRVYQIVGQAEAARRSLERARELGAGDRVDRALGSLYVDLKREQEAKDALSRWLSHHPEDATARLELGKAFVGGKDDDAALKEFQRAILLDPELEEAQRLAGLTLGRKGKEGEGYYRLALAAKLRGELGQALVQFSRARELLGDNDPRAKEIDQQIEELRPIVTEEQRERAAAQQRRRRGPM